MRAECARSWKLLAIVVAFACISVANAKLWRDEEDDPVSWDKGQYGGKKADVGKTSGFGDGYDADPDDDTSGPVLTMEDVSEDNEEGMEMEDVDARIEARADGTAGDHIPEDAGAPPQGEAPVLPGVGAPPGAGGAPAPDTGKTDADGYKVVDELPKGAKLIPDLKEEDIKEAFTPVDGQEQWETDDSLEPLTKGPFGKELMREHYSWARAMLTRHSHENIDEDSNGIIDSTEIRGFQPLTEMPDGGLTMEREYSYTEQHNMHSVLFFMMDYDKNGKIDQGEYEKDHRKHWDL